MLRRLVVLTTVVLAALAWGQWTPRGGGDHSGADWTPADSEVISGFHYNIGTFHIPPDRVCFVLSWQGAGADTSGQLQLRGRKLRVEGRLDASGRGFGGGGGGQNDSTASPGGLGGTDSTGGRGQNGTWGGPDSVRYGGGGGGGSPAGLGGSARAPAQAGYPGTLSAGGRGGNGRTGASGGVGGNGYGGGGGGGGGGAAGGGGGGGGGIGGLSAFGTSGANGAGSYRGTGGAGTTGSSPGSGQNGGYLNFGVNGDNTTDSSVYRGSGGGGAGTSSSGSYGGGGGGGGAGGGAVRLEASESLFVSGTILTLGAGGGRNGGPTFTTVRGGGGAGGGVALCCGGALTISGTIDCRGYNRDTLWETNGGTIKLFYGTVDDGNATYRSGRFFTQQLTVTDVGCTRLVSPASTLDSGVTLTPACSTYNYGTQSASYTVRMRIGSDYNASASVVNHPMRTWRLVTFPAWTAQQRGSIAVSCSTELIADAVPENNCQRETINVRVIDVGVRNVVAPVGTLDSGSVIVPACSVVNYGNVTTESYQVRMRIGPTYSRLRTLPPHEPGEVLLVTFPAWTVTGRGTIGVSCSTELWNDMAHANDKASGSVTVSLTDAGVTLISAPAGNLVLGRTVSPRARVRNFGSLPIVADLRFVIADSTMQVVYDTTETGIELAPGESLSRTFAETWFAAPAGPYFARAWTILVGDGNPVNDTARSSFRVGGASSGPWTPLRPMPDRPSSQKSKDGAWIAPDLGRGWACVAKGNKTADFYVYDLARDTWLARSPIPSGVENKRPSKGAAGCSDGYGKVYATKGNNTQGFYGYSVGGDTWRQLAPVPLGTTNKRLKGGTDLVYASNGLVYLLKGYKNEFWCYNPATDTWLSLPDAPGTVKWDRGSWLVHDNDHTIFAHKAKSHEFFSFDIVEGRWSTPLKGMPAQSRLGSNKKSKDGGCATWFDIAIYALKGGNTQEFWKYFPSSDSWVEVDTMPLSGTAGKKKKVKAGADIATVYNQMYALKGNKTNELWQYTPEMTVLALPRKVQASVQAAPGTTRARYEIRPNPVRGSAVLHWPGGLLDHPVSLSLFDAAGRLVQRSAVSAQSSTAMLDLKSIHPGIYVVLIQGPERTEEMKLVVR